MPGLASQGLRSFSTCSVQGWTTALSEWRRSARALCLVHCPRRTAALPSL